jgi:hypothetical protein
MDLIYKIFNAGLVGSDKGKGGLFGNERVPHYLLCFITHIGTRQIRGSNVYNKSIVKRQKVLGLC